MVQTRALATSTLELLERARQGDDVALESLCRRYLPRLQRWASGRLPGNARQLMDTHDLVQEAVVASIQHLDGFRPRHPASFHSYLRTAVLNRLRNEVDRWRRRPARQMVDSRLIDPSPSPVEDLVGREALERYEAALQQLSPAERELVIARVEMGLSHPEIAQEFGKPTADAARMAVKRALLSLAAIMRDLEGGR